MNLMYNKMLALVFFSVVFTVSSQSCFAQRRYDYGHAEIFKLKTIKHVHRQVTRVEYTNYKVVGSLGPHSGIHQPNAKSFAPLIKAVEKDTGFNKEEFWRNFLAEKRIQGASRMPSEGYTTRLSEAKFESKRDVTVVETVWLVKVSCHYHEGNTPKGSAEIFLIVRKQTIE